MKKVIEGQITSVFGPRRDPINHLVAIHQGIDLAAPVGTPIYSPTDGAVVAVYDHAAGGRTLILRSADGAVRYGFCHLQRIELLVGQPVRRGQLVARSGNTGRSTGPHLHFSVKTGGRWVDGVYQGGGYVDPTPYLDIK